MKHLFIVLILSIAALTHAAPFHFSEHGESWNGQDKQKHFVGSVVMAGTISAYTDSPTKGFAASMAVGIAKELYDSKRAGGSGFSYKDLTADVLGSAVGAYIGGCLVSYQSVTCKLEF